MPTWIAGTEGVIQVDNAAGSLTDYSDYIETVTLDASTNIGQFFTLGLSAAQTTEGRRTFSGSLGYKPATDSAGFHNIVRQWLTPGAGNQSGSKTVQLQIPNSSAGSFQFDYEIRATSGNIANVNASGDGTATTHTVQYNVDGDVTSSIIV